MVRCMKLAPMLSRKMERTMLLILFLGVCVELDYIRPARGRIGTLEIMLDGIGKDIGFALAILFCILLGTEDDGLASMQSVNPIYHLIETLHLLELFGIDVEEILLNRRVGSDAHDDDSGLLVLVALAVDFTQDFVCSMRDSNG